MTFEIAMFSFPLILVGVVFQFTPLMTRPGIFFGATVAADFPHSHDGRRVLRSYRWQVALWSIASIGLTAVLTARHPLLACSVPLCALLLATGFTYWQKFREVHANYGTTRPEIRRASLALPALSESFDLRLLVPPFAALAIAALYLGVRWNQIPARFPTHWDMAGQPDGWSSRTLVGVYRPLLLALGFNLFSLGVAWLIARLARKTTMRYITVRMLQVLLYPLTLTFIVVSLLPLLPIRGDLIPAIIFSSVGLTILAIAIVLYWSYRKVIAPVVGENEIPEPQSDNYWKAGMFYYNRNDPAIFVAKRVGIGYTLNFANKWAWIMLALLLAFLAWTVATGTHHRP